MKQAYVKQEVKFICCHGDLPISQTTESKSHSLFFSHKYKILLSKVQCFFIEYLKLISLVSVAIERKHKHFTMHSMQYHLCAFSQ